MPIDPSPLQTAIVGVALAGTACLCGAYLWWHDRGERYLLYWTLAWLFVALRWALHVPAGAEPLLRMAEIALLAAATSMAVLGANEAHPRRRAGARRIGLVLAALFALTLAGGLASGRAVPALYALALAEGTIGGALLIAGYRATRLRGYLVLALCAPVWLALNLAGLFFWGEKWRSTVLYPLVVLPMMMGFLMVAYQRARQRALDAERKLARIFDTAPVPLVVARHPKGEAEQFNQAMLDLTGLSADELRGHTGREANVLAERDKVRAIFAELNEGGSVIGRELEYLFPSGRRAIAVNASTVELEDGRRYIFALHDLTRLRDLESQARATLEKFTALFDTNPVGIALMDVAADRIDAVNDACLQMMGVTREHALATKATRIINWLDPQASRERYAALMRGERLAGVPGVLARPDGRVINVLISGVLLHIDGRKQFMLAYHDVTAQRRAETAIQQINTELEARVARRTAQLRQANADLESFSYTVAHDLRAPLRAITGFAGILEEDARARLNGEDRAHLARISAAALRMSGLLDGLLEFARTGRAQIEKTDIDMRAMAIEVIAENPDAAAGHVKASVWPMPAARGDALLLRQVWRNLIDNACKFSRKGGDPQVEIGANLIYPESGAPPVVEYYVRDNGVGFDMEHAGRLFGVFQRLHDAADFTGTGVGLAIAERIVTRHGGTLRAQSAPGQGATFTFTLGQE